MTSDAIRSLEKARVHIADRRRGGLAARGARAATREAAHDRVSWSDHALVRGPMADRFYAAIAQTQRIEGRNVVIEYRWAQGRNERMDEIVAEFVRLKVDVILTHGTGTYPAKQATAAIPIVFAIATDPVNQGLVASLPRPGGNATGLSIQGADVAGKRVELLRELIPHLHRLAIVAYFESEGTAREVREAERASRSIGLETTTLEFQQSADIVAAFETLRSRADGLYVVPSPLMSANRIRINTLVLAAHLPTMFGLRESVELGGLISYGPNFPDLFRRAAEFVDKILRGTKPGDIPVEQPTKFDLVINLTTAKTFGITVPDKLLAVADAVIE